MGRKEAEKNEKTLNLKTKIAYGVGVGFAIPDQVFNNWILKFYAPAQDKSRWLMSPGLITIALVFSRITDAINDPLVAYYSDRCGHPRGRRIPFIAVGAVPLGLLTVLFFTPPARVGSHFNFIYLSMIGALYFLFYTIVGAPYNALIPEISRTFEDRVDLSTFQALFRLIYTAMVMAGSGILVDRFGYAGMAAILSAIAAAAMFATVFGVDEKGLSRGKPSSLPIFESIRLSLRNRAFIPYLAGVFCYWSGFNFARLSMIYFVTEIMGRSNAFLAVPGGALLGSSLVSFPLINHLAKRYGNRKVMLWSALGTAVAVGAMFFLGSPLPPVKAGIVLFALAGVPVAGPVFIFYQAMLSDISKFDAFKTGTDREGMFFGIQGFALKGAAALPMAVMPFLFARFGNTAENPLGIRLTALLCAAFSLLAFICYYFYPEDEILRALGDERRPDSWKKTGPNETR